MIEGKIKHILPRIGSLSGIDYAPEVKVYVKLSSNERCKETLLGIVFTLYDDIEHSPKYVNQVFQNRYIRRQKRRARKIGGRFRKMINDGFGK